jgi:hypothetical protein
MKLFGPKTFSFGVKVFVAASIGRGNKLKSFLQKNKKHNIMPTH